MTPNEMRDLIRQQLGYRTDLNDKIFADANLVQDRLENDEELGNHWFLTQEYSDAGFVTAAATKTVAVPSTFLDEDEDHGGLYIYDSTATDPYIELKREDSGLFRRAFEGTSGQPTHYDLVGANIEFGPTPDAIYSLRWFARFRDADILEGSTANLWLTHAPLLIVAETGLMIAGSVHNDKAVGFFSDLAKSERRKLTLKNFSRETEEASMGGDN